MSRIHHFGVQVDIEGEYKLSKTILGDTIAMGIYAPVVQYNCDNYWLVDNYRDTGVRGIQESDELVFRLPQVASSGVTM